MNEYNSAVAVVTGAGGTLCSAMAIDLAKRGARVALLGRTLAKLEAVQQQIEAQGGQALCVALDATRIDEVAAAARQVDAELGPCRILVNGVGGKLPGGVTTHTQFTPAELQDDNEVVGFLNADMQTFRNEVDLNLLGAVIPSRYFGRQMAAAGGGSIINFASMTSFRALSRVAPYAAAKAAIVSFTEWLAAYLAPAQIRVNAIAPGFFINERSRKLMYQADGNLTARGEQVLGHTPAKRFGGADELLGCLHWLLDPTAAGFVTGITVPVDGGFLACPGV
jgi:NAD(P)-dependent dehydrogenase (short-subunit alcohol dehydrogenase family)